MGRLLPQAQPDTGRVLWRLAYEQRWPVLKFDHNPAVVDEAETTMPDRVGMYNSCHLATVPPGYAICEPTPAEKRASSMAAVRADRAALASGLLRAVTLFPILGCYLAACLAWVGGCLAWVFGQSKASSLPGGHEEAEGADALPEMLPGIERAPADLGGNLALGLRRGSDNTQRLPPSMLSTSPLGRALSRLPLPPRRRPRRLPRLGGHPRHRARGAVSEGGRAEEIGVKRGSADVVTLCHGLVAEADWAARIKLATELPGRVASSPSSTSAVAALLGPDFCGALGGVGGRPAPLDSAAQGRRSRQAQGADGARALRGEGSRMAQPRRAAAGRALYLRRQDRRVRRGGRVDAYGVDRSSKATDESDE